VSVPKQTNPDVVDVLPYSGEQAENGSAQARLRRAEERFRLFMENVKEYAIFMLDVQGRVIDWNLGAEHILGYGSEVLGQPFSIFFPPDDRADGVPERELQKAAEAGQASDDRWHVRKDGSYFWALGITTAMRDDKGELRGFAKVLRDSTDRKRLEEQLREQNKALEDADRRKDEFLAMLAHELRNPLAPIFNGLTILQHDDLGADIQRNARSIIDRQVRTLARLIDDLLDVSRITMGKVQLARQRVNLNKIVRDAVEACTPMLESRKHELNLSLPADVVWIDADPTRIEQVITNLVNNAAKYTPESGRIEIALTTDGPHAAVRVKDNGIGIAADLLPRIFDLFTQGDPSLDRTQAGLGIGLTLVRKLVEMHDGTVHASSDGPGKGSEFVVVLPVLSAPVSAGTEAKAGVQKAEPLRVMVVDDNVDAVESLSLVLSLDGHDVATSYNATDALKIATEHRPDVMLLDIGLPDVNGYQLAEQLARIPELRHVVLIAMTGYGQDEARQRSAQAGFAYHLVKPVDPHDLERLLASIARDSR
jgi:PAS domain S-box-containing protein